MRCIPGCMAQDLSWPVRLNDFYHITVIKFKLHACVDQDVVCWNCRVNNLTNGEGMMNVGSSSNDCIRVFWCCVSDGDLAGTSVSVADVGESPRAVPQPPLARAKVSGSRGLPPRGRKNAR